MQVFKNNVSLEATPASDTHVTNKGYVDGTVESLLDDTSTRSDRTWSSEKISKINVTDAKKVDSKPTYSAGTITYIKDGASYTTTNNKQWFYYLENEALKQTIFIDGEELTIDGASVDFDDFIEKTDIVTVLDAKVTNEQVPSAKSVNDFVLGRVKPIIIQYDFGSTFSIEKYGITQDNTASEVLRKIADYYNGIYGDAAYLKLTFSTNNNSSTFSLSLPTKGEASMVTVLFCPWKLQSRCQITAHNLITGELFTGGFNNSANDIVWKKVCTTSVTDFYNLEPQFTSESNYKISDARNAYIECKNGWVFVNLPYVNVVSPTSNTTTLIKGLPKPRKGFWGETPSHVGTDNEALQYGVDVEGAFQLAKGSTGVSYRIVFSYPVSES